MCLIIAKEAGVKLPPEDYIRSAAIKNSDGLGIAYWKPGSASLRIKKDFTTVNTFLTWFRKNIKQEDSIIIHFRLATSGLKDNGNRHPFPVTLNGKLLRETDLACQMAVAHNGVLSQYNGHKKYSDTQKFIMDILADPAVKDNLGSEAIRKLIDEYLNRDRLSIMETSGRLYLFGDFETENGIHYSNSGYKPLTRNWENDCGYGLGWKDRGLNSYYDREKYLEHKDKNIVHITMCVGCFNKKHVKTVEYQDNEYELCKKCRKKLRKGMLPSLITNSGITDLEEVTEIKCDNCAELTDKKDIHKIDDYFMCTKCKKTCNLINL